MKKVLEYIILLIVIAILYTVCIHSYEMVNGVFTSKSVWFQFFLGLLMISFSIYSLADDFRLKLNKLDVVIFLLLAYIVANSAFHDGLFLSGKNMESLGLIAFFLLLRNIYANRKFSSGIFIFSLLLLAFLQIGVAFLQWNELLPSYNSNFRVTGFFFNPSPFAIFLSALLVYCLAIFLYHSNKIIKGVSISLFLTGIPIVLFTLSRSAFLGLIAGIFIVLESKFQILKKLISGFKSINVKALIIIVSLTVSAAFASYYLYHLKKDSADGRLLVWKLALKMVQDRPLTGIGEGNFPVSFLKYQSEYFHKHPEKIATEGRLAGEVWYAFNDILQITAEQGIIGLLLLGIMLTITLKFSGAVLKGIKSSKPERNEDLIIGSVAALLVILVSGLFSYALAMLPVQILFYTSLALLSANYSRIDIASSVQTISIKRIKILSIAAVYFTGGIYFVNYARDMYDAYKQWHIVESKGYEGNDIERLVEFHFILNQDPWFIMQRGEYFLIMEEYSRAIKILEEGKDICSNPGLYYLLGDAYMSVKKYKQAEDQYIFVSYAIPNLVRPKYLLAKLYKETGQNDKWKKQALEVINFKPKVQSLFVEDMIQEIKTLYYK